MDLSDALGSEWSGAGQPPNPTWPGQPANPMWPGGPAQPANPTWPGGPTQPANPTWPGGPAQPANPTWPGGPAQPANPTWPGGPAQPANPTWPGGPAQPSAPGGWPSPAPGPGPGPGPAPSNTPVAPQQSLGMPYSQSFPSGLYDKMLITIAGTIKPTAQRFLIDFNTNQDLVFHLNPRFNEDGKKVIVRNSEIGKKWGKEERELQQFPFVPGQPFEMKILVTNAAFKVAVNNSHLLEFKHRATDLRAINRMSIHHDITLSRVNVETLP